MWLVGDDHEVLVIDAGPRRGGDRARPSAADGSPRSSARTRHNDHINAAPELAELTGAPILLHPDGPAAVGA